MSEDTPKRAAPQRSNSTKIAALTMLKSGNHTQAEVSRLLGIPTRTLRDWKKAAIEAGTWDMDAAGDNNNNGLVRPAPRAKDPGSGGHNRKITDRLKRRIKQHLENDPFLTPHGLQRQIPALREVSHRSIRRCIAKDLGIPARRAAIKPQLTQFQ